MRVTRALGLYSGGLDSTLACRVIAAQGIEVKALKFVTPFFDHHLLSNRAEYRQEVHDKYGLDVELIDLSDGYIDLLKNPAHGYGKNFNPCIDCKIFMLTRARKLMETFQASFLITGEVLGQRPMSQRRDTLRVIERESGCEDILLRPLCAHRMEPTRPEREGLVDRVKLYGFSGRGRRPQMELAEEFGIKEYPAPAGGCVLTDPNLAARIERFYKGHFAIQQRDFTVGDIQLLLVGRHFRLTDGSWFVLGRDQGENERISALRRPGDILFFMPERPGPTGLLRASKESAQVDNITDKVKKCSGLVVRFGRKMDGELFPARVLIEQDGSSQVLKTDPVADSVFRDWIV